MLLPNARIRGLLNALYELLFYGLNGCCCILYKWNNHCKFLPVIPYTDLFLLHEAVFVHDIGKPHFIGRNHSVLPLQVITYHQPSTISGHDKDLERAVLKDHIMLDSILYQHLKSKRRDKVITIAFIDDRLHIKTIAIPCF